MADQSYAGNFELPFVTIFGAGIAGLTAAHELIERGFRVQVVEHAQHAFCEYECAVGGLAANQYTRVRAPISELHPAIMKGSEVPGDAQSNLAHALKFRDWKTLEASAPRYPLLEKIRFDKNVHGGAPAPADFDQVEPTVAEQERLAAAGGVPRAWADYWDARGALNRDKLAVVLTAIRKAVQTYRALYFPKLAQAIALGKSDLRFSDFTEVKIAPPGKEEETARTFVARETLLLRILGYTDADGLPEDNRRIGFNWASQVYQALLDLNAAAPPHLQILDLPLHLEIVARGAASANIDARARADANRVEFQVVEQIIPGEHGFRFFPGFYRHLFDTMKRTPIFDVHGVVSGSAFDQLVSTPRPVFALADGLHEFDMWHIRSLSAAKEAIDFTRKKLGFTTRDMAGLQFKLLRYLTSGAARRAAEAEPTNMIDYLTGGESGKFSDACLDFLEKAPRALAAMSARESDARTQYNITAQLMDPGAPDPRTLNGPTSPVWLEPWKAYLKTQGVHFFLGQLDDVQLVARQLVPVALAPEGLRDRFAKPIAEDPRVSFREPAADGRDLDQHRFIVATQYQVASKIAWKARAIAEAAGFPFDGPFRQLTEFDTLCGRQSPDDADAQMPLRDPATGKENFSYPTRTISGIQYFFPQAYRVGQSNVYFVSQPWGLTSISQYAFWRDRVQPVGPLLGQISVDIGDWHAPYPEASADGTQGHPAWHASSSEVAENTWAQIRASLSADYAKVVSAPRYYHIDQNLIFSHTIEGDAANPGVRTAAAVRANARVRAPNQKNPSASIALATDRVCRIEFHVGQGKLDLVAEAAIEAGDDNTAVRGKLLAELRDKASGFVLAAPAVSPEEGDGDLVLSPRVQLDPRALPSVLISVLDSSSNPFVVALADRKIESPGASGDAGGVADDLAAQLKAKAADLVTVARVGAAAIRVSVLPDVQSPVSLGVLNLDGAIELVGAPILNLKVTNLQLVAPAQGFSLLRNNYQYQINIPDQWRARPGLHRGKTANIPGQFADLSAEFGVPMPEIYYGHPPTCPMLRAWYPAGTYMATYTRMTTMEAANESGRHAVAGLLYALLEDAEAAKLAHQRQLAGDFPQVWNIEDQEPEDLKYFKKLDESLFAAGLPHLFDILSLPTLLEGALTSADSAQALLKPLMARIAEMPALSALSPKLIARLAGLFSKGAS